MRAWMIVWVVAAATVGAFSLANWQALSAPVAVSLLLGEVNAPLGLVMLGAMATLALLFLLFVVWLETKALLQLGRPVAQADGERVMHEIAERMEHLEKSVRDEVGRVGDALTAQVSRLGPPVA